MSLATDRHTDNIVVGAGELYLDLLDDGGKLTGERYLGDGVSASLSVTTERTQVFSGTGPVARQLVNAVRSLTRSMSITLHGMSPENLALFVGAPGAGDVADAAAAVIDEALTVRQGRYYQLGVTPTKPTGIGAIDPAATPRGGRRRRRQRHRLRGGHRLHDRCRARAHPDRARRRHRR